MSKLRKPIVSQCIADLINITDPDPLRPGLQDTPRRFAEAWEFWTSGYEQDPQEVLKDFEDGAEGYHDMVFQRSINFFSLCEHHLTPFFGVAHIGYIPNGKIVGISKFARLVDIFAHRLQVQERMTAQIADALFDSFEQRYKPSGLGVVLQARHLCMESRGVQKLGTTTTTSALRGIFLSDPEVREEFFAFVRWKVYV